MTSLLSRPSRSGIVWVMSQKQQQRQQHQRFFSMRRRSSWSSQFWTSSTSPPQRRHQQPYRLYHDRSVGIKISSGNRIALNRKVGVVGAGGNSPYSVPQTDNFHGTRFLSTSSKPESSTTITDDSNSNKGKDSSNDSNNDNNGSGNDGGGDRNTSSSWGSTFLINAGWVLLGLVAIDQLLQYKQEREMEEHRKLVQEMQHEANLDSLNVNPWMSRSTNSTGKDYNDPRATPPIYQCKIKHVERMLDGTKMLPLDGLRAGSVVDIIEENVGPNEAYHLCRVDNGASSSPRPRIGWYPIDFLEKV